MKNMSKISIQDKIDDAKMKVDKALYNADVFFIIEELEAKDSSYKAYCYLSSTGNQKKFGILGFNEETKKPEFVAEWVNMTRRNEIEGVEFPEAYIVLKNEKEFIDYFCNVPLSKILSKKK